jgi:hypothetical protein
MDRTDRPTVRLSRPYTIGLFPRPSFMTTLVSWKEKEKDVMGEKRAPTHGRAATTGHLQAAARSLFYADKLRCCSLWRPPICFILHPYT